MDRGINAITNVAAMKTLADHCDSKPFLIVIPAFGEEATIAAIVAECTASDDIAGVIVVDDGSGDATASRAEAAGALVLRNRRNLGKGASLVRGMEAAMREGAAGIITLDGDGQHRPEDLARMIACGRARPDCIVIGSRRVGGSAPPGGIGGAAPRGRYIANRIADFWISWASGFPVDDSQSGFRVYPMALLRRLQGGRGMAAGFSFESEILIAAGWVGVRTVSLEIPAIYGAALRRRSHFRPVADITRIVLMVARRLLRRGMHPAGLWRWFRRSRH